jgi:hypothetical protein
LGDGSRVLGDGSRKLIIAIDNNLFFLNSNPRENDKIVLEIMIFAFGL